MENLDLRGLTTRDIFIVKSLIRSLKKNPPKKEPKKSILMGFLLRRPKKRQKI